MINFAGGNPLTERAGGGCSGVLGRGKNDEICTKHAELCIEIDGFCIEIDGLCR